MDIGRKNETGEWFPCYACQAKERRLLQQLGNFFFGIIVRSQMRINCRKIFIEAGENKLI
ncbi:hypothetical protein CDL12_01271 [Handroanthus impetiginosus]|uniref:Uncharacterized protein n=1 Tax=Handroanthus impetiginosus TaxID=429701 RepID=A0A2G9I8A9_9LAMI|nr:hypothetical protein CDL12_01271 [Handroanthus impetiginosus]